MLHAEFVERGGAERDEVGRGAGQGKRSFQLSLSVDDSNPASRANTRVSSSSSIHHPQPSTTAAQIATATKDEPGGHMHAAVECCSSL